MTTKSRFLIDNTEVSVSEFYTQIIKKTRGTNKTPGHVEKLLSTKGHTKVNDIEFRIERPNMETYDVTLENHLTIEVQAENEEQATAKAQTILLDFYEKFTEEFKD